MPSAIIAHGVQLMRGSEDGSYELKKGYISILCKALEFVRERGSELIFICGGRTTRGLPSEASAGKKWLGRSVNAKVALEDRSTSFAENVQFVRKRFRDHGRFDTIYVIARATALARLKILYGYFWPEIVPKLVFVGTPSGQGAFRRATERLLYVFALYDPEEEIFLKWPKILLRNKKGNG